MKYYQVKAKCGHVGRNNYIPKTFYIKAEDGKEAASKVRKIPRVKHGKKFAVLETKKITKEEYLEGIRINKEDLFLKVTCVQQQRVLCPNLEEEIIKEEETATYKKSQVRRHLVENVRIKEWQSRKNYIIEY
ncbi:MAG: hypothetical protein SO007_08040 [Candidatus Enteromonas sp.]|nr:hypothetical protein [Candidatus Enteromonas sp.]